jgi:hypothetical protein
MPPVSQKQRAAMWAAASGKSTLGIPRKVGKEFAAADPGGKLPARVRTGGMLGPNKRIARKAK